MMNDEFEKTSQNLKETCFYRTCFKNLIIVCVKCSCLTILSYKALEILPSIVPLLSTVMAKQHICVASSTVTVEQASHN